MKYLCDPHIVPTNTCPADLTELTRRNAEFSEFAPEVQLDVSDGLFSPVTSWPYAGGQWEALEEMAAAGEKLAHSERVYYEAHLMVQEPIPLGTLLARAGCRRIMPHIESFSDEVEARAAFAAWRAAGAEEVGLSLLIDTPLERVDELVDECAVVQLMSIGRIGAQGQPFDDRALSRVEELHAKYPMLLVAVDGGISESNVEILVRAGANRLCVGSAISRAPSPADAYEKMHTRALKGCAPVTLELPV
jgi:ribulose-phosphate 3-epimerase